MTGPAEDHTQLRIAVPKNMTRYAESAILRLGYLYSQASFALVDGSIEVKLAPTEDIERIKQEVRYCLYREKIYAETLSLRHSLLEAVTKP